MTSEHTSGRERARGAGAQAAQREQLLDAAIGLFAETGDTSFSMRELARRVGYAQTVVYRHFDGKDGLLEAIVTHGFDLLYDDLPELDGSPDEILRRIGAHYLAFGLANLDLYQLMFDRRPRDLFVVGDDPTKQERIRLLDLAAQALTDHAARLGVDAVALADALWAQIHGLLALHAAHPEFTAARAEHAYAAMTAVLDVLSAPS